MPKRTRPRRGSLQFWPRKRAKKIVPRTSHWPKRDAKLLGFAGWKAGMTHVQYIDQNNKSPTYGRSISKAVTVLDAPSLFVAAIRFYSSSVIGEKWAKMPKGMKLKIKTGKDNVPEKYSDIRLLVATQPSKSAMRTTKSDVFEIGLGGSKEEKLKYAESVLGKEITAKDAFKPGEYIDVSGVTKGYGFMGPVKRFGIRIQTRKDQQMHRHTGSIGGWKPRKVDWRVPLPGQYGFFTRTEFTKKIVLIEDDAAKITPKGGFVGYGLPKSSFILIEGSVPGPRKRLIRIRKAIRSTKTIPADVKHISLQSKQRK